jgi:hypothetical protein
MKNAIIFKGDSGLAVKTVGFHQRVVLTAAHDNNRVRSY